MRPPAPARQRGAVLLEALIAFSVLAVGLLSLARWQSQLRESGALAALRSEAVGIAESEFETLRTRVGSAADGRSLYAAIAGERRTVAAASRAAEFRLTRSIETGATIDAKLATVDVAWTDRAGRSQHVALASILAPNDPALLGAAALLPPAGSTPTGAGARAVAIPAEARDLGDGRSAWQPVDGGTLAFVLDNASGQIVARCEHAASGSAGPTAASLGACDRLAGLLLSGVVRFTAAAPPDPADANDMPRAFTARLTLGGGTYPLAPSCGVRAMKTVTYLDAGQARTATVAAAALPATLGLATWTETGERYARYDCAIFPRADGRWSGRADLVPDGWALGTTADGWRVCRRVADLDHSGAIDANREHPAAYSAVGASLGNQNFLVIRGDQACPTPASAAHQP